MTTVILPLDIDHTCQEKGQGTFHADNRYKPPWRPVRPNECPACCYERGYLDARPWLKKAKEKATT